MNMRLYQPNKIYVEADAAGEPLTRRILSRLPSVPVQVIENAREISEDLKSRPDGIGEGKRSLLLRRDKGLSFKPFPEAADYLSCDYFTLHLAEGCDLECSYCILQAYLTNPLLTVHVNLEEILQNLETVLQNTPGRFFRIGTGQLADSLSIDHITGFSEVLVPFFARQPNAVLELKTKSDNVGRLLTLEPQGKTIVSWSVNSKKVMAEEEHKCATLAERLEAAQKIVKAGYRAGFHFDPLVDYPGWENDYEETAREVFSKVSPKDTAWVSMGCLRFMPSLKPIMQDRFPKSRLPLAEWITGMDGKMRYFKPRRIEMYRAMKGILDRHAPGVTVYLCMESPEVWRQVFGGEHSRGSVCALLDRAGKKEVLI